MFRERARRAVEDDARGSRSRPPGSCPRCAHPREHRRAADAQRVMNTENMALVQGWDDTRAALRAGARGPRTSLRPWALGSLAVASAAAARDVGRRQASPLPTPSSSTSRASRDRPTLRRLRLRALPQLARARAARAAPASPASSPARRCRGRRAATAASGAGCTTWPARWRSPSWSAATLFSLATQAWLLGQRPRRSRRAVRRGPGELLAVLSLHAIPELTALFLPLAAWTMASRRKAVGRAAGRDVRDGRDRDPDPARRRRASRCG